MYFFCAQHSSRGWVSEWAKTKQWIYVSHIHCTFGLLSWFSCLPEQHKQLLYFLPEIINCGIGDVKAIRNIHFVCKIVFVSITELYYHSYRTHYPYTFMCVCVCTIENCRLYLTFQWIESIYLAYKNQIYNICLFFVWHKMQSMQWKWDLISKCTWKLKQNGFCFCRNKCIWNVAHLNKNHVMKKSWTNERKTTVEKVIRSKIWNKCGRFSLILFLTLFEYWDLLVPIYNWLILTKHKWRWLPQCNLTFTLYPPNTYQRVRAGRNYFDTHS